MLCLFVKLKVSAKEQENHKGHVLCPEWSLKLNTGHGSHLACFSINAVVQRRQMRIMVCAWVWGGRAKKRGEKREGDRQFNSNCYLGGGKWCMAPSQRGCGKQWSRLMIHSQIIMAPTERMGTRHSSSKPIPRKHMSTSCKSLCTQRWIEGTGWFK